MSFNFKNTDEFTRKVANLYNDIDNCALPVLDEKEEQSAVYHLLHENGDERKEWQKFLQIYTQKYPLSNLAGESLFARLDVPEVRTLALKIVKRYGCAEGEAKLVCDYLKSHLEDCELAEVFYHSQRVFFSDVYSAIASFSPEVAETYKKTALEHTHGVD